MKGDKQIDKLLHDFLPADEQKPKPKRKVAVRPLTLKQKALVHAYTDKTNKKTYGNKTQSGFAAYNVPEDNSNLAANIAHVQLNNAKVMNYLEEHCKKMGIGQEVRTDVLHKIIHGKVTSTTITRHKVRDPSTGRMKLTSVQETDNPPRTHDRISAIKELNTMTGLYKQQEIDKHVALSEVNAMYDKIVGTGRTGHRGERGVS